MWFDVNKDGLAALVESRPKSFILCELIQNAWDAGAKHVEIEIEPLPGSPFARIVVEDDSVSGWKNLDDSFTLFGRSTSAGDVYKRGRFCMGEKIVLSLCRKAWIETTTGTISFDESGRRRSSRRREAGTRFEAEIRMTRDELDVVIEDAHSVISPAGTETTFNHQVIQRPTVLKTFDAKLPTIIQTQDGVLRSSMRSTTVEVFAGNGSVLELGIPICEADWPWRLNVLQKVPLNMERDCVTEAFRRALQVAAINAMSDTLDEEQSRSTWATEALGDSRIIPTAAANLVKSRFGERAVVAVPGDPMANANAEATGCTVIHGGALPSSAWANVRKHNLVPTSSQAFPTPKPQAVNQNVCPTCKRPI